MSETFLDRAELRELTGRRACSLQIEALRKMVIPFWVNALGKPVVPRSAIEGRTTAISAHPKKQWAPPE